MYYSRREVKIEMNCFLFQAGDDAEAVRWQRVSGNIPLFASHVGILEKVASMHEAAFY